MLNIVSQTLYRKLKKKEYEKLNESYLESWFHASFTDSGYSAPSPSYGAPAPAPEPVYAAPAAPSYTYSDASYPSSSYGASSPVIICKCQI